MPESTAPMGPEESVENGAAGAAEGETDGPTPLPYERAQRRLRVDGVVFGAAVRRLREAEGWSLRTLSKKSGVPLTTVANIERGDVAAPDVEVSTALALTFGYGNPGALLGAGATSRTPGRRHDQEERDGEPGPMRLDQLMEYLVRGVLRGVWSAPSGQAVTVSLPAGGAALAPRELAETLPQLAQASAGALPVATASGGVALSVGLVGVVVVGPTDAAPPPPDAG